jgi:hypothetical protein
VHNFTVKCEGVGEVTWSGLTDVRWLDLDQAVQFSRDAKGRSKVAFYGGSEDSESGSSHRDDADGGAGDAENGGIGRGSGSGGASDGARKQRLRLPKEGEGLNKQCVITLIGFQPEGPRQAKKMHRRICKATEQIGGRLINYDSGTGAWTFALQRVC